MTTFKYIIVTAKAFRNKEASLIHIPVIFGHFFNHGDIAQAARGLARVADFRLEDITVYSAGFVDIGTGQIACHGESVTLGLKPKSGDAEIIRNFKMGMYHDLRRSW